MPEFSDALEFHYKFTLRGGRVETFHVALDAKTLQLLNPPKPPYPSWTDLTYKQCPNCPLDVRTHPQCPAAVNVSALLPFAQQLESFEEADIEITVKQRTYQKVTAVQYGLSSLMGIFMTTAGCPVLDHFRPMVKTHLPFAKAEEVTYRTVSMYLLAQFLRMKEGKTPDWNMDGLLKISGEIQTVNQAFWKRITSANPELKDGGVNALSHLDTLSKLVVYHSQDEKLKDLKTLFAPYLRS